MITGERMQESIALMRGTMPGPHRSSCKVKDPVVEEFLRNLASSAPMTDRFHNTYERSVGWFHDWGN